jgi:predicted permease
VTSFLQDIRFAARVLAKSPGFTLVAVLTLALGIGANVAAFGMVRAILLNPLPFTHPEQIVRVFDDLRSSNTPNVGMSVPELWDFQQRAGVFQDISVIWPISADLTGGDRPERVEGLVTSANYFTMLGAHAELGRLYTPQDAQPGFSETVTISDALWHRLFGGDPHVLGKKLRLDQDLYTVVGVMPPDFRHPGRTLQTDVDVYLACGFNALPFPYPPPRGQRFLPGAIARLKPGLSVADAQTRLANFASHLSEEFPNDYPAAAGWAPRLIAIQEDLVGNVRSELLVLFGAVVFVLLIGCVNLATFLLARSAARQREVAVRLALGASRARLIRQLLTEGILIASFAGAAAVLAIVWLQHALMSLAPADLPRLTEVNFGGGVLLFALVISILTGLLFGLVPALQASSPDQVSSLREGSRGGGSSKRQRRLSRILVASEIALSLILLIGAGLLLRSFREVLEVHPGFNPHGLLTSQIWLPVPNDPNMDPYRPPEKRVAFLREVIRRVSTIPGVEMTAADNGNAISFGAGRSNVPFTIEGRPLESQSTPVADQESVSPGFFRVLQTPLESGRFFTEADDTSSQKVVLIDETLARRYWLGESPLGHRIKFGALQSPAPWMTIVGVVGNVKTDGFTAASAPHIYACIYQNIRYAMTLYLRTSVPAGTLGTAIRRAVESVDPNVPVFAIRTMDEIVSRSIAEQRFALQIVGMFSLAAMILAAMGIYGVMAYSVSQRTHEIGIRVALGAQRADIFRMTVGNGMLLVAYGVGSGLVGSILLMRFLRSLLFAVTPTDPATFIFISALLAVVALVACYVPARRATRVDPLVALREE